jgi:hypothetical protein
MRLVLELNSEELIALNTSIIVEMWEHVGGAKACGITKQKYLASFNEKQRKTLSAYYPRFYDWHLRRGVPQRSVFRKIETIDLIKRAVSFFATI